MKPFLTLVFLLGLLPLLSFSQKISGVVQDSSQMALPGATVMLLRAEDSVLNSFALTNNKGEFKFFDLKPSSYVLQVSFLGYAKVEQNLTLTAEDQDVILDPITLLQEDLTLSQVNIETEKAPIRMKDDTLEYNADVFGAQPGENVEDLLRKLPGVEVDQQGNIEAQGQRVNKVLVDGKEFFGNDPKMATKNLPADAIDKVQVFDEKSDKEDVSGIDDGEVNQTINLELKEDKKSGAFGNVEGGYGTDDRYKFKGNINRFSPKLQASLIGMANNVNEDGFSFNEYIQFMGGLGNFMENGNVNIQIDGNSGIPISGLNENGLMTSQAGGANANVDFSKKLRLSTNYLFSGLGSRREDDIRREQFLNNDFFTSENENFQNTQFYSHRLGTSLRFRGDSIARFNLSLNAGMRSGRNDDTTFSRVFGAEENLENTTERISGGEQQSMDGEAKASYITRLKKKGRTLSLSGNLSGRISDQSSLFRSLNTLFPMGVALTDTLRQEQSQEEDQLTFGGRIELTEPLGNKGASLTASYRVSNTGEDQNREVYDLFPEREFNTALSNRFRRDYLFQNGGIRFGKSGDKITFSAGMAFQQSRLQGQLISLNDSLSQTFENILPSMRIRYRWGEGRRTGLRYSTSIREPRLNQLQPFLDNRNPFNLYQGNPNLRPEYHHDVSWDFLYYDQFSFTSFFAFLTTSYIQNPIVEAREVDSLFRQIRTPVNVDESVNIRGSFSFNTPIRPIKAKIGISARPQFNRGLTFVNGAENLVNRLTNNLGVKLENRKKKVWDGVIGADWAFNTASYSEASQLNRSFLNQTYYADFRLNFLKNWIFRSQFDWNIYAGGNFTDNVQVPLLRASLTRQFFNKKVRVELEAFDLLNQNKGIRRRAELNYIEDGNSLTLRRYVMLKVSYSVGNPKGGGGGAMIIDRR